MNAMIHITVEVYGRESTRAERDGSVTWIRPSEEDQRALYQLDLISSQLYHLVSIVGRVALPSKPMRAGRSYELTLPWNSHTASCSVLRNGLDVSFRWKNHNNNSCAP